jgi:CheY-like chemotaxis protein
MTHNGPSFRCRVLIVDPHVETVVEMGRVLHVNGYQVCVAFNSQDAFASASLYRPDAVLIDLDPPALDGLEVARTLRTMSEAQNALLIAAAPRRYPGIAAQAQDAGFDMHLLKPLGRDTVLTVLAELPQLLAKPRASNRNA